MTQPPRVASSGSLSQAAMKGVPLPVAARRRRHGNVARTMRDAHVGDREVGAAVERGGQGIVSIMAGALVVMETAPTMPYGPGYRRIRHSLMDHEQPCAGMCGQCPGPALLHDCNMS